VNTGTLLAPLTAIIERGVEDVMLNHNQLCRTHQQRTCRAGERLGIVALLALLAILAWTGPATALMAVIEIAVPLEESEDIQAAAGAALIRAAEGARAMGLPRVHLVSAQLNGRTLVLTVLAADQVLAEGARTDAVRPAHLRLP
jgi:hypothetical protein